MPALFQKAAKSTDDAAKAADEAIDRAIDASKASPDAAAVQNAIEELRNTGTLAAPRPIGANTWQEYEAGIRGIYGEVPFGSRKFKVIIDGKVVNGVADNVATINGRNVAVEAKFAQMLEQARKYTAAFDEVIYHSNSPELIAHYTKVFQDAGITNFRYILTE